MKGTTTAAARQAFGAYGETLAARHLTEKGLVLLDRNWRSKHGEVDLVLRDGDTLVACEVKTRSSVACGTPQEAVDEAKVARLRRTAEDWVSMHAANPADIRVDIVAVLFRDKSARPQIDHVVAVG